MFIFDGHCDSLSVFSDINLNSFCPNRQFDFYSVENLSWVEVMAAFCWKENREEISYNDFLTLHKRLSNELPNGAKWLKSKEDFVALNERQSGVVFSVEGVEFLEKDVNKLYDMYNLGVRMVGLSWNNDNFCAGGCMGENVGLSTDGIKTVKILNELGVVIDGAHLAKKSLKDVLKYSTKPIVVSHTGCNSLCEHKRNLTDEEIKKVANSGGVVGISFVNQFLYDGIDRVPSVADLVEHIFYVANLVGSEYVALGSDFDGVTNALSGMEKAGHLLRLPAYLRARGFGSDDINNIMGENWRRVFINA